MDTATDLTVLCARAGGGDDEPPEARRVLQQVTTALDGRPIQYVGRRPGKQIDSLLHDRVMVIGDDADLAAVVTRLLRRDLLGEVVIAYAPLRRTPATVLWSLPVGAGSVALALRGEPDVVPLVRDDNGGVLVGEATIGPLSGTVYVDEYRVLSGAARGVIVQPDHRKGVSVTVVYKRYGVFGRRPAEHAGRAVQIGAQPAARLIADGRERDRPVERWTYYKHTAPLRLVRGVVE